MLQPAAASAVVPARTSVAPAAAAITPDEARRAIAVLQDGHQREQALRTLQAIAAAVPASSASAAAPASAASTAKTPAVAAASAAVVPLKANGLVARTLRQIGRWADNLGSQLHQIRQAAFALPALFSRSGGLLASSSAQHLLIKWCATLAVVFGIGLLLEWGLRRLLRRPRRALIDHADNLHVQEHEGRVERRRREPEQAYTEDSRTADVATEQREAAHTPVAAGVRPASDDVALVHTQHEGVDEIEAVKVGSDNTAADPVAESTGSSAAAAAAKPPEKPADLHRPHEHWNALRHFPLVLGVFVLDLLPLAVFFVAAGLLSRWLATDHARVHAVASSFINAYVTTRIVMAILRLLISPLGHGLQVLHVSRSTSAILHTWLRIIVIVAAFGLALADAVQALGADRSVHIALVKSLSLLVHVLVVILIFRLRRPVGDAIRPPVSATGALASARSWLAQVWAFFAAAFVMGVWVVWALGVEDGFPKLIHFIGVSAGIVAAARLAAVFALGMLGRVFGAGKPAETADGNAVATGTRSHAARYYPLVRGLVSMVVFVGMIIALFQAWGLDAVGWFARGHIGRNVASAVSTIIVSVIIAIVLWEAANIGIERRLDRWTRKGDLVRAARLRTLLPMLRTCLFIVVLLVVGLTGLSELGINTTPLLASASIVGVALGFGSQKLVQDFITGIFLLMENAMQVGDWITVAGVSGSVEYLSIRTVRLRGGDGSLYTVPFSSVTTVNNTNRGLGNAAVHVSVNYDTDVARVVDALKQIGADLRKDPAFKDQILNDIEVWGVDSVDGSMVTLAGQMRCSDKGRWGVQREINRRILERFRELGIAIANPRASLLLPAGVPPENSQASAKPAPPEPDPAP